MSLKLKGKLYVMSVRSAMIYGSETWAMTVEHIGMYGEEDGEMNVWCIAEGQNGDQVGV